MLNKEAKQRLFAIQQMCQEILDSDYPMLIKSHQAFKDILSITKGGSSDLPTTKAKKNKHIILSCSCISDKEKAAMGAVFEVPNEKDLTFNFNVPNKGYIITSIDTIYRTIVTFCNLKNSPRHFIEVRNDCREAVELINREEAIEDKDLKEKVDMIRDLSHSLPVPLVLTWLPQNSTSSLKKAYKLANS